MCFDEFHVSDIADAMILGRLMQALFDAGVVFCITSNYSPDGLYPNGLQRELFLPTIELLRRKLDMVEIDAGHRCRMRALEQAEVFIRDGADGGIDQGTHSMPLLTAPGTQTGGDARSLGVRGASRTRNSLV